ncbi:PIN domain-containing protein [Geodermatophilus sp. DF01-2]|uniref:TA system VapC family ribonuclease toxin n=1 Tax=Geodermatophilus sp. DF01-2 TaxID=2559610 RepID=UPI00107366CE|nr:TA system VapC family ribonuclease toxin [Geodermatophilus sp. DF01_2]TFV62741.1 PIN domain-containing protein [Geodermatophilus sp. DF01_2]
MTVLLDANVLIALVVVDHVHHGTVESWLAEDSTPFATCPVTQGALLRHLLRGGADAAEALSLLRGWTSSERHEFWPDDLGHGDVDLRGVVGHRQVTDAYLAGLARVRGGRLATLDRGLALLHPDVALLLMIS